MTFVVESWGLLLKAVGVVPAFDVLGWIVVIWVVTRSFFEFVLLDRLVTVEDVPVGSGEVPLVVIGVACVLEFGEEDRVGRSGGSGEVSVVASAVDANEAEEVVALVYTNEVSVAVSAVDANEAEEVVALVDTNEVGVAVSAVDANEAEEVAALVDTNEVGVGASAEDANEAEEVMELSVMSRGVPFGAVVVSLSLALHRMPCRRVPMMNKQNRELRN